VTRVTVWTEYRQERNDPAVAAVYPDGIHTMIAEGLRDHVKALLIKNETSWERGYHEPSH